MPRPAPTRLSPLIALAMASTLGASEPSPPPRAEVPAALAWMADGRLAVALRDGRAIALVDPANWSPAERWPLPIRPSSLATIDDGSALLVGGQDGEAMVIGAGGTVRQRFEPGRGATRVLALPGGRAAVASCWDEAVRIIDPLAGRVLARHPLPFATGALVATPEGRLVVADAFGGHLAEVAPGEVGSERYLTLAAVNMHGLAISGDGRELLVAHMAQDAASPITRTNIDWGLVYSSKISAMRLTEFVAVGRGINVRRLTLDGSGHGAADPTALAVSADGTRVYIASAGAHQVLLVDRTLGHKANADLLAIGDSQKIVDREVGRSPLAIAIDPSGRFVVTADAMADTLTILRADDLAPVATVALHGGRFEPTPEQRGEAMFRDGRAAMDRWMSCASCHVGGHTNGLNFDTRGDGGYGAPKNVPTLLGAGPTAPFGWNGRFDALEDQVRESLENSLHGRGARPEQVEDLVAFLKSLGPPPPRRSDDDPASTRGAVVFASRGCDACHAPPAYTRPVRKDVGLDDGPGGNRRFNPPSLRGVSRTAPYLHDGRAKTLRDVLAAHHPGSGEAWGAGELDDLVAFLESL